MDQRTAQVVILIDQDVVAQLQGEVERTSALIKLACFKLLSSFQYNPAYRQLRWAHRFYNQSREVAHRRASWKEFSIDTWEEFEKHLDNVLATKPPPVAEQASNEPTPTENVEKSAVSIYSNVLSAVIEDFQWEMADICSPVKSTRASQSLPPSVENYVFSLQVSPMSMQQLDAYLGLPCRKHSHLSKALMTSNGRQRWLMKNVRLYWIDVASTNSMEGSQAKMICSKALADYNGDLLTLSQIIHLRGTTSNVMLSAMLRGEGHSQAPAIPVSEMLSKLLQLKERKVKCRAGFIKICLNDRQLLSLVALSLQSNRTLHTDCLYVLGIVCSRSIHLHYLDQHSVHLCTDGVRKGNSQLSRLLIEMSINNTELVLLSNVDDLYYILKPLTLASATLTQVKQHAVLHVEKCLHAGSNQPSPLLAESAPPFTGAMIEGTTEREGGAGDAPSLTTCKGQERLREIYRANRLRSKLVSPVKRKADGQPVKEGSQGGGKVGRSTRAMKMYHEAAKKRVSLEASTESASSGSGDQRQKKITLTTLSSLTLSTEDELIKYLTDSYSEACSGGESLYLTAQKMVNTARVFYKKHSNPSACVENLVMSQVIKSTQVIRKSCSADSERKIRECKMSSLLLLELEVLRRELSEERGMDGGRVDSVVSSLEEYLTCMSIGKPHLLKDFIHNQLVPSYQISLAPVLGALLTDFGQDLPASLKRLIASDTVESAPSLGSVSSRHSGYLSPVSGLTSSVTSMFSEPSNSLLSSSMAGTRSLHARSMSEVGRRSMIAVPGELLKKRRSKDHRLSDKGVASRTRSKTPKKDGEQLLTEFPAGFLSRLNDSGSLSQPATASAAVRRSPRLAGLSHPPVSTRNHVKRDLFSSPTTAARRHATRSPRRPRTTSKQENSAGRVLVAETPLHKQGLSASTADVRHAPPVDEVVEETPAKTDKLSSALATSPSKPATNSVQCRFGRKPSFYDIDAAKSRNVQKFQKLENRMKCSLSSMSSPRRAAKLILRQALSQPMERVSTRLTPQKDVHSSPCQALPRLQRKSASLTEYQENVEPSSKPHLKKKLFQSPQVSRVARVDTIVPETPEKQECLIPENSLTPSADTGNGKSADVQPSITNTPTKRDQTVCTCRTRTPSGTRRSPRSCTPSYQSKVCKFAHGNTPPLVSDTQTSRCNISTSPSPKRLNFLSRKRATDPYETKHQHLTSNDDPPTSTESGQSPTVKVLPMKASTRSTPRHQRTPTKYSPLCAKDIHSLMNSPFVLLEKKQFPQSQ